MKNLYVIRHPQTEQNVKDELQGVTDSDLTEQGKKQLEQMAEYFLDKKIDIIFTSPLPRCLKTADYISQKIGVRYHLNPLLREVSYGNWEKHTKKQLTNAHYTKRENNRFIFKPPGVYGVYQGESYKDLYDRLVPFWSELALMPEENILVVAHSGVIMAAKKFYGKLPDRDINSYRPGNKTILKVSKNKSFHISEESPLTIYRLENFQRGWILGDFDPTIVKTKDFEVAIKHYKKGDREKKHLHKKADEYTVIISGIFKMNGKLLKKNDIVWVEKNQAVDFECVENGSNVVVKMPSVADDKYIV